MYGTDSDEEERRKDEGFVELKPEVVDFPTLHKREEELYFYDTFSYPWEKEKHYKMVYQLEKKYFPDQCLDKAFLEPGEANAGENNAKAKVNRTKKKKMGDKKDEDGGEADNKGLVFFEKEREGKGEKESVKDVSKDVTEKKVDEFFKCLKKFPNKGAEIGSGEPYLVTRSGELPPTWDTPYGTVVLVNKPKGETLASLFCYKI